MSQSSDEDGNTPVERVKRSSDFTVDLNKANPSPLDFINRRMAEESGPPKDDEGGDAAGTARAEPEGG